MLTAIPVTEWRDFELAFEDGPVDDFADRRKGVLVAAHGGACRLITNDESIGLTAVEQAQRHTGIGGMKERALALDEIPVIGIVGGGQPFSGARDEVGDYRIDRDAPPRDQDAGLARRAELGPMPGD